MLLFCCLNLELPEDEVTALNLDKRNGQVKLGQAKTR